MNVELESFSNHVASQVIYKSLLRKIQLYFQDSRDTDRRDLMSETGKEYIAKSISSKPTKNANAY